MIVLDLEWNTVFWNAEDGSRQHFDEIIQIGAVRMVEGFRTGETFNAYVHNRAGRLNPTVAELVHITDEELENAEDFPAVAERFMEWCGENPRFFTWSNSDIPVLRQNFLQYALDTSQVRRAYNVQFAYSILKQGNTSAVALNKAVDACALAVDEPFHSALGDAIYTARLMEHLWSEFGGKTREKYLYSQLQKLRMSQQKQPAAKVSLQREPDTFQEWLQSPWKYSHSRQHKKLPCNTHRKAYFRQTGSRTFACPKCKKKLSCGKWLTIEENRYVNHLHCADHGHYYALMRLRRKNPYLWEGVIDLYPEKECGLLVQWMKYSQPSAEG